MTKWGTKNDAYLWMDRSLYVRYVILNNDTQSSNEPTMARKSPLLLLLAPLLLIGVSAVSSSKPFDVLVDNNYDELKTVTDVNAEFDAAGFRDGTGRRLQSSTETTYCSTWCQLKDSLGLTIVGFLLICIR
jgi:hypothetical protein